MVFMKIKITESVMGNWFTYRRGDIVTLPESEAKEFLARGIAEPVIDESERAKEQETETAAINQQTKNTKRKTKAKGKSECRTVS